MKPPTALWALPNIKYDKTDVVNMNSYIKAHIQLWKADLTLNHIRQGFPSDCKSDSMAWQESLP
jgi:hypothetical protein